MSAEKQIAEVTVNVHADMVLEVLLEDHRNYPPEAIKAITGLGSHEVMDALAYLQKQDMVNPAVYDTWRAVC